MNKRSTITRHQLIGEHETLSFLVWSQYSELFGRRLKIEHAMNASFYFLDLLGEEVSSEMVDKLQKAVQSILESDKPIEAIQMKREELIDIFTQKKMDDKIGVLKVWQAQYINCLKYGEHIDYVFGPYSLDKERLKLFKMKKYLKGFVLCFPTQTDPMNVYEFKEPRVLQNIFDDFNKWKQCTGIYTLPQLNDAIYNRKIEEIKWTSEALHQKQIVEIANGICANLEKHSNKRVITIGGSSSSNKTTFSIKLAIALHACGHKTLVLEMDNFFVDEKDSPIDEDGNMDWESIDTLNVPLLAERINALLRGETVKKRKFDWERCISIDTEETMTLEPGAFLIMEGIHGINPKLLNAIGQENVTPIYVQTTSPVNIDYNHRFPCSDYRLIRRFIRDYYFRSYPPRLTIELWTRVRYGEMVNIFPYQDNAEFYFNSCIFYELPVLSLFAKGLLAESTFPTAKEDPDSPNTKVLTTEVHRLIELVNLFYPIQAEQVPHLSGIREFIGGSDLKY